MMGLTPELTNVPQKFVKLFRAGKEAARQGDRVRAHDLFRQAIEIDPYHEQVWLWLASVVDTDDDRRVCFENVLELNPDNQTAQRQLQRLEIRAMVEAQRPPAKPKPRLRWSRWLLILLLLVIVAGMIILLAAGIV